MVYGDRVSPNLGRGNRRNPGNFVSRLVDGIRDCCRVSGSCCKMLAGNPKMMQSLQQDPLTQDLLKKYVSNLEMSVKQQENKRIGRLGVQPGATSSEGIL